MVKNLSLPLILSLYLSIVLPLSTLDRLYWKKVWEKNNVKIYGTVPCLTNCWDWPGLAGKYSRLPIVEFFTPFFGKRAILKTFLTIKTLLWKQKINPVWYCLSHDNNLVITQGCQIIISSVVRIRFWQKPDPGLCTSNDGDF